MITYLYWIFVALLMGAAVFGIGIKGNRWKPAAIVSAVILLASWSAYYFGLEQVFVKRYGGVMTISVPEGYYHITATWKDDHLWVENYDPQTNSCIFSEYSKGNMLQGRVTIRNCNPLIRK
jgi:Na+-translocating ferredoxin:NAD+ oxidoreductase RnfD subunit